MSNSTYFIERRLCPSCNSSESKQLYRCGFTRSPIKEYLKTFYDPQGGVEFSYLADQDYIILKCLCCGLLYQKYILNDFLMGRLYDKWINPEMAKPQRIPPLLRLSFILELLWLLKRTAKLPNDLCLLDYGMGWGEWGLIAKELGFRVFGFDIASSRIQWGESQGIIMLQTDEMRKLKFDFINTEQVLEHVPDPQNTIMTLSMLLKADGIIKVSIPNAKYIQGLLKNPIWLTPKGSTKSLNPIAPLEHINGFTNQSLMYMATRIGLRGISLQNFDIATCWLSPVNWTHITTNPTIIPFALTWPFYREYSTTSLYRLFKRK